MPILVLCLLLAILASAAMQTLATPDGAGYAIVLNNNPLVLDNFQNFPTEALTFEAWISTYYTCHSGTLMSYALDTETAVERRENLNHFVISHESRVIGCHDYERTFPAGISGAVLAAAGVENCLQDFTDQQEELETDPMFPRDGSWMHVAVTWSAENDGETIVYKNGEIVGRVISNKTRLIQPNGIFMLGGKQNCFGGCSIPREAYFGLMDEVRVWNVSRTQTQIQDFMTQTGQILGNEQGLVAYWTFDDPDDANFDNSRLARDMSGNGNHLELFTPPIFQSARIVKNDNILETGAFVFERNYALNKEFDSMPEQNVTVEFWARILVRPSDPEHNHDLNYVKHRFYLMSYVTRPSKDSSSTQGVNREALSIYVDLTEWNATKFLRLTNFSSRGSVWVGFNKDSLRPWMEFDTKWVDNDWHHLALTHDYSKNNVRLFFDGNEAIPFWKSDGITSTHAHPNEGGVGNELLVQERSSLGSLALGIYQDCFGGCFFASSSLLGAIANFRIWDRVLSRDDIRDNTMRSIGSSNLNGLVLEYEFSNDSIVDTGRTTRHVIDRNGVASLFLGSLMPHIMFSAAPLSSDTGTPLDHPTGGDAGYALQLNGQHIILKQFLDFPIESITIEFSMWSIDKCNLGVPFSYSAEVEGQHVDMFTLANYNRWNLIVNGDSRGDSDISPGFASTDGVWHHIAATWDMKSGEAALYDNGRLHWKGIRNQGVSLIPNGTLVLGREQDCLGGCFGTTQGTVESSKVDLVDNVQDFIGLMDNARIWNVVRTSSEIKQSLKFDLDIEQGRSNTFIMNSSEGLVAWWRFNEGSGRRIRDSTENGHTLRIRGRPLWTVPNRVESCGDGILNDIEECDDGNRENKDGCDINCHLERTEKQTQPDLAENQVGLKMEDDKRL
eukprot:g1001.t1